MNNIKTGDFVEIIASSLIDNDPETAKYIMKITENLLFAIKGIILKTNINNEVFTKHT